MGSRKFGKFVRQKDLCQTIIRHLEKMLDKRLFIKKSNQKSCFFLRGLSAYLQTNPSMGMSHMGTTWLCPKTFPKIIQVVQRDPLQIWWVSKSTKHELRCPTGELSSGKSNKKSEHDLPFTKRFNYWCLLYIHSFECTKSACLKIFQDRDMSSKPKGFTVRVNMCYPIAELGDVFSKIQKCEMNMTRP